MVHHLTGNEEKRLDESNTGTNVKMEQAIVERGVKEKSTIAYSNQILVASAMLK
jgi:hypothetical protein